MEKLASSSYSGARSTYILLILTAFFWGSAFVGSKMTVSSVSPSVAALIRFGLASIFMLLFLQTRNKEARVIPRNVWLSITCLGFIGIAVYNFLFFWGLNYSAASDGSMIIPTMSPVITMILASLLLKEKVSKRQTFGLILALMGALIFFTGIDSDLTVNNRRILGDLFFLTAAACWSIYTIYGNKVLKSLDPLVVTTYTTLSGTIFLGIFAAPDLLTTEWSKLGLEFWTVQFYLAIFPTLLGNSFYYLGVKKIGGSMAAMFMYFVPVSGLILSGIILDEILTLIQMIGSILMIAGVYLVNRRTRQTPAPAKAIVKEKDIAG